MPSRSGVLRPSGSEAWDCEIGWGLRTSRDARRCEASGAPPDAVGSRFRHLGLAGRVARARGDLVVERRGWTGPGAFGPDAHVSRSGRSGPGPAGGGRVVADVVWAAASDPCHCVVAFGAGADLAPRSEAERSGPKRCRARRGHPISGSPAAVGGLVDGAASAVSGTGEPRGLAAWVPRARPARPDRTSRVAHAGSRPDRPGRGGDRGLDQRSVGDSSRRGAPPREALRRADRTTDPRRGLARRSGSCHSARGLVRLLVPSRPPPAWMVI